MDPNSSLETRSPSSLHSSLLEQAKLQDAEAWSRLVRLYGPVVYRWARLSGLQSQDAADVVQDVFASLVGALQRFRRDEPGHSFRAWLRTITQNKIRDHARRRKVRVEATGGSEAQAQLDGLADPTFPTLDEDESALDSALLRRALEMVRAEFEQHTWLAFWQTVVEGKTPSAAAEDLGTSVAVVYQAKSRILRRLRAEFDGLLGEEPAK